MGGRGSPIATAALALCILVLASQLWIHLPLTHEEYSPDEGAWVAAGHFYFQKYFVERDWSAETWSTERFGYYGKRNPVVAKYIIGGAIHLDGAVEPNAVIPGYGRGNRFIFQDLIRRRPPDRVLEAARAPMRWLGVIASVILFLLARELTRSWLAGVCAALLFMAQPLVLESSRQAMLDMPALTFSLLGLWIATAAYASAARGRIGRACGLGALLGLVCGLAISSKLSALVVLAICAVWAVVQLSVSDLDARSTSGDARAASATMFVMGLALVLAGATTLLLNPLLLAAPITNSLYLLEFGEIVAGLNVAPDQRLDGQAIRWRSVFEMGLASSGVFHRWLGWRFADALLAAGGLTLVVAGLASRAGFGAGHRRGLAWLAVWFVVTLVAVVAWTPFRWRRWYLPLEPCWAVLEGMAVAFALHTAYQARARIRLALAQRHIG